MVVPWSRLEALNEPFYPKNGNYCPPLPLSTMFRIHFIQQWFGYADPAVEETLHDIPLLRQFAGVASVKTRCSMRAPSVASITCCNSPSLPQSPLPGSMVSWPNDLSKKRDSVVDVALIAALSFTKNQDKERDSGMTKTKRGNQWYFGMASRWRKIPIGWSREAGFGHEESEAGQVAHIGVDACSGLIHTVECANAKVADNVMLKDCLHGDEKIVFADLGYEQNSRTTEHPATLEGLAILVPTKKPKVGKLTAQQKQSNRILSALQVVDEHPFRLIKQLIGFTKIRYRGLKKNTAQIAMLFALANLWMALHRFMPPSAEVRP